MQLACQDGQASSSICMCTKVGILSAYCYVNDTCMSWIEPYQQLQPQQKCASLSNISLYMDSIDHADGLAHFAGCFGAGGSESGGLAVGCVSGPKRSDSLPGPADPVGSAGFFPDLQAAADEPQSDHETVLFELTRVPAEDLARELTLIFLREFQAITPDELTSLGWSKRDKLVRAPNVVRFTLLFNRVNFWAQRCILEAKQLPHRAAVLAHFIRLGKKLLRHQNLHAAFAVLAALQSQPVYRLKRTWDLLPRKCCDAYQRLVDLFSADNNHDRLRRFLQEARLPIIPYLGLYMNDLVYIDACYPSTGGLLEAQSRTDQMNNICRIISENQQSAYSFPSKPHIRRYLESQSYIEEMQSIIEAENYNISLELEPKQGSDSQLLVHRGGGQDGDGQQRRRQRQQHQPDSVRLKPPQGLDCCYVSGDGAGAVTMVSHRKSKSLGDASALHDHHAISAPGGGLGATPRPDRQRPGVGDVAFLPMSAGHPNGIEHLRNLIDDSLPVSTADCSNASLSSNAPVATGGAAGPLSAPPSSPPPLSSPAASPQLQRQQQPAPPLPRPEIRLLPSTPLERQEAEPLCQGPLERKSIFKLGKRQTRSRYRRFWAELTLEASGPQLRLYPPCQRLLLPSSFSGGDRRRHYKEAWKHAQSLENASLVDDVGEVDSRGRQLQLPQGGNRLAFQINFDDQCESAAGRQHASLSGLKFSSYKYRVCHGGSVAAAAAAAGQPLPGRDHWVAAIRQAIDMCRQEKALIDFNDAAPSTLTMAAASATTASSSRSGSAEWTCL
ncbi:hypothetical protein BOX15_Mlig012164g2 [Macrostomum lignano]|uniref:Uncharacterized protein n=2 Tax=Macrostomum lignano TaxID=282301 RepID=A0A267DIE1_9PLAT|nr:hypothetical protein BOX15_Mlig012164g2 [Macrostomum lignano]